MWPRSGYRYKEADGTLIVGQNWRDVIVKVISYRKRNNLPLGNPEVEVNNQACQNNPSLCHEDSHVTRSKRAEVSLKGRVLNWFNDIRREGITFVAEHVARERANVCANCPKNTSLPEGCATCKGAVKELRRIVLGKDHPVDERVAFHGCIVLGSEPATDAWLDRVTVENPELPAHCWRKRS
jgi:hypothetical protein